MASSTEPHSDRSDDDHSDGPDEGDGNGMISMAKSHRPTNALAKTFQKPKKSKKTNKRDKLSSLLLPAALIAGGQIAHGLSKIQYKTNENCNNTVTYQACPEHRLHIPDHNPASRDIPRSIPIPETPSYLKSIKNIDRITDDLLKNSN